MYSIFSPIKELPYLEDRLPSCLYQNTINLLALLVNPKVNLGQLAEYLSPFKLLLNEILKIHIL